MVCPVPISAQFSRSLLCTLVLAGCATAPPPVTEGEWQAVPLPGKAQTQYRSAVKEGRPAISALAEGSASMWRKRLAVEPQALGQLRFSWWVEDLIAEASVGNTEAEDSPARIVLAFDGDRSTLSARNRTLFELAQALTGEVPPFATLMYVYDAKLPVGTVVVNHRTDRIRKIVVDSGSTGLRQWRDHARDVAEDFRRAYGEAPGALLAIGLMTDADNSRSRAKAWYGEVALTQTKP
jgi:hypothetical protein